jgi:predicted anti-sigma-YlaC factor YlaD
MKKALITLLPGTAVPVTPVPITPLRLAAACLLLAVGPGCSLKKMAINQVGNALASGGSTYESDDDPDLVSAAIPFGLKMYESLLEETPKHTGLLLAAASGFTEYSYAFVDARIDEAKEESLERADALRDRARRLYLRANRYGMRGLETLHAGFGAALDNDADAALKKTGKRDVPLLYWTAASRGLAISLSKTSPEMIAELPLVETIVRRVAELDEGFNAGAVPEFLITLEAAHSGVKLEEQQKLMRQHFDRAIELSKGKRAGTYVSFAENASLPAQNQAEFQSILQKALAVDADADPPNRLANLVAQRRARWLLKHTDQLFLEAAPKGQ